MSQYKLSYYVAGSRNDGPEEKIANTEIELAAHILDMERDVGMLVMGVTIEKGSFTENRRANNKLALEQIKRWAQILEKAPHIR